jgi:hypothetical protein
MLHNNWYDDRLIFPIMPPGIKLSGQHSLRLSNAKGKMYDLVHQLSRHQTGFSRLAPVEGLSVQPEQKGEAEAGKQSSQGVCALLCGLCAS